MIKYKNKKTDFELAPKEVAEYACKLIIFCNMNKHSRQAKKLRKQLSKLENTLAEGKFRNNKIAKITTFTITKK